MSIEELLALSPEQRHMLLRLDLSNSDLGTISCLVYPNFITALSQCTSLHSINLSNTMLNSLGFSQLEMLGSTLAKIPTLKKLDLSHNNMYFLPPTNFKVFWNKLANCPCLEALDLAKNNIALLLPAGEARWFDHPDMKCIYDAIDAFFNALTNFKNLKCLNLSNNSLGYLLGFDFEFYQNKKYLHTFVQALQNFEKLEKLSLQKNILAWKGKYYDQDDIGAGARVDSNENSRLRWHTLTSAISQLPSLTELDLTENHLIECNPEEMQILFANLSKARQLRYLNLKNNELTYTADHAYEYMEDMINTSNSLLYVDLNNGYIDNGSGGYNLSEIVGFCRCLLACHQKQPLTQLDLGYLNFGSDRDQAQIILSFLDQLAQQGSLLNIDLRGSRLEDLSLNDFKELCRLLNAHSRLKIINLSRGTLLLNVERISIFANLLAQLESLEIIDLSFTNQGNITLPIDSFKILCNGLAKCQSLRKIYLQKILTYESQDGKDKGELPIDYFCAMKAALTQCQSLLQIHQAVDVGSKHQNDFDRICNAHIEPVVAHQNTVKQVFHQFPHIKRMILGFAHPNLPAEMFSSLDKSLGKMLHQRSMRNHPAQVATDEAGNHRVDHNAIAEPEYKRHKTGPF